MVLCSSSYYVILVVHARTMCMCIVYYGQCWTVYVGLIPNKHNFCQEKISSTLMNAMGSSTYRSLPVIPEDGSDSNSVLHVLFVFVFFL